jgi:hypothetical protein
MKPSHPMWPRIEHACSLIRVFVAVKYFVKQSRLQAKRGWDFDFLQASPSYFDERETAGTKRFINTTWQNSESSY